MMISGDRTRALKIREETVSEERIVNVEEGSNGFGKWVWSDR